MVYLKIHILTTYLKIILYSLPKKTKSQVSPYFDYSMMYHICIVCISVVVTIYMADLSQHFTYIHIYIPYLGCIILTASASVEEESESGRCLSSQLIYQILKRTPAMLICKTNAQNETLLKPTNPILSLLKVKTIIKQYLFISSRNYSNGESYYQRFQ